jgi:SAM-dependent methyltransferase
MADDPCTSVPPGAESRRYTHCYAETVLASHRERTAANSAAHLLTHLHDGMRLLDVGSGAGTITADLARIVGSANVTAVEVSEQAADVTRAELERQGFEEVRVLAADAHDLPFADDSFDVVHAHQVLQHVADPVEVLRQMRRVTTPGGVVAVRDADYDGFRWFPDLPELERWRILFTGAMRANGGTPDAGRHLLAWVHAAGFTEVTVTSSTWCYAEPASRASWARTSAGRIHGGAVGAQLLRDGEADEAELEALAEAWARWAGDPDGWISLLHGEVLAWV